MLGYKVKELEREVSEAGKGDSVLERIRSRLSEYEDTFKNTNLGAAINLLPVILKDENKELAAIFKHFIVISKIDGFKIIPFDSILQFSKLLVSNSPTLLELNRLREFVQQMTTDDYLKYEEALDFKLSIMCINVIEDPNCTFADGSNFCYTIINLINLILTKYKLSRETPESSSRNPLTRKEIKIRLSLIVKIQTSHLFYNHRRVFDEVEQLDSLIGQVQLNPEVLNSHLYNEKSLSRLEERICNELRDQRRWLFIITEVGKLFWTTVTGFISNKIDEIISKNDSFQVLLLTNFIRPQFLTHFTSLKSDNKM